MANLLTQNPIIIDTQMTDHAKTTDTTRVTNYQFTKVYWLQPTTIGHLLEIQNRGGKTIVKLRCEVADQSQYLDFNPPLEVADFEVNDLDSGVVYIYCQPDNRARG